VAESVRLSPYGPERVPVKVGTSIDDLSTVGRTAKNVVHREATGGVQMVHETVSSCSDGVSVEALVVLGTLWLVGLLLSTSSPRCGGSSRRGDVHRSWWGADVAIHAVPRQSGAIDHRGKGCGVGEPISSPLPRLEAGCAARRQEQSGLFREAPGWGEVTECDRH